VHDINPPFKKVNLRNVPKGIEILFEDKSIIVIKKSSGLLSIATNKKEKTTAHTLLNLYVNRSNARSGERIYIVHRLDRDTSGVLVFAKSEEIKETLQEQWSTFSKQYVAVVDGILEEKEGELSSYLVENKAHIMYSTKDETLGKFAKTAYKVKKENKDYSLLEIKLHTGRKNQIRVHFADIGHPISGDKVYGHGKVGKHVKRLALHAASLTIVHPVTKRTITFQTDLPAYFKSLVKNRQ
jgi:23S rRNA pseudouridine1911/1915/1917 synthase